MSTPWDQRGAAAFSLSAGRKQYSYVSINYADAERFALLAVAKGKCAPKMKALGDLRALCLSKIRYRSTPLA